MPRRNSRSPLIAAVDMFICFAVTLFVILGQPQSEIQQQITKKQEDLTLLDQAVEERREDRRAIEAQIASTREQLEQRQREFADWDLVVESFRRYSNTTLEPNLHVYLRPNGIFSALDPKRGWTREELKSQLEQSAPTPGTELYVAFYVENGANDQLRTVLKMVDEINHDGNRVFTSTITLPSGVIAGAGYHVKGGNQ